MMKKILLITAASIASLVVTDEIVSKINKKEPLRKEVHKKIMDIVKYTNESVKDPNFGMAVGAVFTLGGIGLFTVSLLIKRGVI